MPDTGVCCRSRLLVWCEYPAVVAMGFNGARTCGDHDRQDKALAAGGTATLD
jgi:hypothetical protein